VIVADNFHPARSGSGSLYTVEHFRAVQARLADGGVFCQWLPLHQLDLDTLRSIVRSFVDVYPRSYAMLATNSLETPVIGLVTRNGDTGLDLRQIRATIGERERRRERRGSRTRRRSRAARDVHCRFGLARSLRGDAPMNTDDRPIVAYRAPHLVYAADSMPRDRLLALLREVTIVPGELIESTDSGWSTRLAAYWSARDRFLEVGRDVVPTARCGTNARAGARAAAGRAAHQSGFQARLRSAGAHGKRTERKRSCRGARPARRSRARAAH
jgi:spermidine synthase